ncbi:MAG TPA: hypothetical protein VN947_05840 [Polyangia bacterium]|nr:hypothetical protein [Polyangia bacterium]
MATAREEAERILKLSGGDTLKAYDMVERQLSVLVLRTQVMLSLSGIVITVTGFSGRAIAETSILARTSIATGIMVVLASAVVAIWGVLRLSWMSQAIDEDAILMLSRGIAIRDAKSRFLRASLLLFIVGFSLYCFAIAQLLMAAKPPV